MTLVRHEIGDVLRDARLRQGRTLRQIAARASVALGYLSEVERGQKEASSEILAAVAEALEVPLSSILREVGDRLAMMEGLGYGELAAPFDHFERMHELDSDRGVRATTVPDTIPDDVVAEFGAVAR